MLKQLFNDGWTVKKGSSIGGFPGMRAAVEPESIRLPHDAMIHEKRDPNGLNKSSTGFYPGGNYVYGKKFFVPADWRGKTAIIEFEGVYMNAMVFINGNFAGKRPNGYTNFYINAHQLLNPGEENEIQVVVKNGAAPNSRWYTGSGIYRNVNLFLGDGLHILPDGVRITTPDADYELATVRVRTKTEAPQGSLRKIRVHTKLLDAEENIVASDNTLITLCSGEVAETEQRMEIDAPQLWDSENPYLYTCHIQITEDGKVVDEEKTLFGVRTLRLDTRYGLRINGKQVKLRGACIHSDNGILGACAFADAEERRARILKAAGFNAIRSAHNPISKAMLDACDKIGLYVMDELSDVWNGSKSDYDYSLYFNEWWERDAEALVAKDFNHPCVIMYSTGNEIMDMGKPVGDMMNRKIAQKYKALDDTRYTTHGLNGLFFGMALRRSNPGDVGAMNNAIAGGQDRFQDNTALMEIVEEKTEEPYGSLDIAGYNYMAARYAVDGDKYKNRVIVGSEDDPDDIVRLWSLVEKYPYVIGDFTWTGYDYLGEAGCGIYHYDAPPGMGMFARDMWSDRASFIGDIDLIGNRRPMSYYREIAYGLRTEPYIAVRRLNRYGQPFNKTKWMGEDNVASWTWPGYEGKPGIVDVFSNSEEVELLLNGKSLGTKPVDNRNTATFELMYEAGRLEAIGYTGSKETGRMALCTASENVKIHAEPEKSQIRANGDDLAYVMVSLRDENGILNHFSTKTISCKVEGAATLQGFGSGDPQGGELAYDDTQWLTFDGYVLAVLRAGTEPGNATITFSADGCDDVLVTLAVQ